MASYPAGARMPSYGGSSFGGSGAMDLNSWDDFNAKQDVSHRYAGTASQQLLAETVDQPVLSKTDWESGEGRREYHAPGVRRKKETVAWVARSRKRFVGWFKEGNRGKVFAFSTFFFLCALALTLYFVIPRAPDIEWVSLTSNDQNATTSSVVADFHFLANVTLQVNSASSYIPVHLSTFDVTVSDLTTGAVIGIGSMPTTVPGRTITNLIVPMVFSGTYSNKTDATYVAIADSCGPVYPTTVRSDLDLAVAIVMKIPSLIGTNGAAATAQDVSCPVEFPSDSP